MGQIQPYNIEELRRAIELDELGSKLKGLGATPEVTDTIRVSKRVLSNLRPTTERMSRNLALYHATDVFVPTGPQMYVQNDSDYRIAFTANEVIYGSVKDIDQLNDHLVSIGKQPYTNFKNILALSADKPYSIGDRISVRGINGTVKAIDIDNIRIAADDGLVHSIPQLSMPRSEMENGYFSLFLEVNAQIQATPGYLKRSVQQREEKQKLLNRVKTA